ncbi:metallophosphoesterase family protein [Paenibacillus piri]|uniref:Metallophosphoesterase n=1 Tax=Paenibacillus piri TaxID=2547395 RepID=A0A4R5KK43_9BACL|nr:metallophosphoesterase family protein [Paenibacillus piri]TDF94857.1 metallophosphoesterase [Paenibacillus piri]
MKIAILSDIHGNARALDHVLADIRTKQADQIIVTGDICYRGPEPKRSLELIRSLNAKVIKGNADEWVVRGVRQGEVADQALEMMNREREWIVSKLDQADIDYLAQLPTEIDTVVEGMRLHLFHATPDSLFEIVNSSADDATIQGKLMSARDAQVYVYSHIHKPFIRFIQGRLVINTGSVGLPFDGFAMASYATLEITDGTVRASIERVGFDIEEVIRQYEAADYPNAAMMAKVLRKASL